jgi:hypothetical protein
MWVEVIFVLLLITDFPLVSHSKVVFLALVNRLLFVTHLAQDFGTLVVNNLDLFGNGNTVQKVAKITEVVIQNTEQ